MNRTMKEIMLAVFLGMVVPGVILSAAVHMQEEKPPVSAQITVPQTEAKPQMNMTLNLTLSDGEVQSMDLEDYLVGVVLAEMPADFEPEALKAHNNHF